MIGKREAEQKQFFLEVLRGDLNQLRNHDKKLKQKKETLHLSQFTFILGLQSFYFEDPQNRHAEQKPRDDL